MKIKVAPPPNLSDILKVFPEVAGKPILFAYGDTIYNPMGVFVPDELIAHEEVHSARQGAYVADWWNSYLSSKEFRLLEEIPAHRAEYRRFCQAVKDRNQRARYASAVAGRLTSKLYELEITQQKALKEILHG